ncbi:MAG: tRNA (adenosine(37)-N6)-threonylcarbamoyltransferase complex dimerization subunit type 1 TsaB [Planctomycetota bacterium]|nr:tRNA (adenosine(37)-N6)-threonylcarbamoyltransferase complex dimerization subunit type 1 TsaB [Planctomycetota bacterium]MDA1106284.1 tRNA (adenosine(37)-N6)-threonylcarbamoyltransferase complex dimerization subunit type 1 TsaB [Planctomycetota bacterium]
MGGVTRPRGTWLAIESSTPHVSVATGQWDGVRMEILGEVDQVAVAGGDLIASLVDRLAPDPSPLSGVVVGTGPGGFTGVRMGVSIAQAIAEARHIPIAGIPSAHAFGLAALESREKGHAGGMAVFTAARGEACWLSVFETGAGPSIRLVLESLEMSLPGFEGGDGSTLAIFDRHAPAWVRLHRGWGATGDLPARGLARALLNAATSEAVFWHADPAQVVPQYAHAPSVTPSGPKTPI